MYLVFDIVIKDNLRDILSSLSHVKMTGVAAWLSGICVGQKYDCSFHTFLYISITIHDDN